MVVDKTDFRTGKDIIRTGIGTKTSNIIKTTSIDHKTIINKITSIKIGNKAPIITLATVMLKKLKYKVCLIKSKQLIYVFIRLSNMYISYIVECIIAISPWPIDTTSSESMAPKLFVVFNYYILNEQGKNFYALFQLFC